MFAVIKMELSGKKMYGRVLKRPRSSLRMRKITPGRNVAVNLLPWSFSATTISH